jgi:hypothetical protein
VLCFVAPCLPPSDRKTGGYSNKNRTTPTQIMFLICFGVVLFWNTPLFVLEYLSTVTPNKNKEFLGVPLFVLEYFYKGTPDQNKDFLICFDCLSKAHPKSLIMNCVSFVFVVFRGLSFVFCCLSLFVDICLLFVFDCVS